MSEEKSPKKTLYLQKTIKNLIVKLSMNNFLIGTIKKFNLSLGKKAFFLLLAFPAVEKCILVHPSNEQKTDSREKKSKYFGSQENVQNNLFLLNFRVFVLQLEKFC